MKRHALRPNPASLATVWTILLGTTPSPAALEAAGYQQCPDGGWLWLGPVHPTRGDQEEVQTAPHGAATIIIFARPGGDLERRVHLAFQAIAQG